MLDLFIDLSIVYLSIYTINIAHTKALFYHTMRILCGMSHKMSTVLFLFYSGYDNMSEWIHVTDVRVGILLWKYCIHAQIENFMEPTWGPPGSCRPQMGPMLAPGTLLSGWIKKQCQTVATNFCPFTKIVILCPWCLLFMLLMAHKPSLSCVNKQWC